MKYAKHRDINGTSGGWAVKVKGGRNQGRLLVFWLEWEGLPFPKQRVWVEDQLSGRGAGRGPLHPKLPLGCLTLKMPATSR